jgi:predicted phage tail protein
MNEDETRPGLLIPSTLLRFIDRSLESERRATEAEIRRCENAIEAYARSEDLRHAASDAKIQKANEVLDYRLEEMNNFRAQINEERAEYLRREMYEREHSGLSDRVKTLEIVRGEQAGKATAYVSVVGCLLIVAQIVLHFWK